MSTVGGGVTVDNDVINTGFWPTDVPDPLPVRLRVSSHPNTPAIMYATGEEYGRVIRLMANYTLTSDDTHNKKPHTSDMFIMHRLIYRKEVDKILNGPLRIHKESGQKLFHLSSHNLHLAQLNSGMRHLDKRKLATILLHLNNQVLRLFFIK